MEQKIGKIYIIENDINNLKYIGQTVQSINNRFKQHMLEATSLDFKAKLPSAIREIGHEHFSIKLIQECNVDELNKLEVFYIKKYNTYHNGYNSTPGGDNGKSVFMDLDIDKFIDMYNNKISVVEMAVYFECSVNTIHKIKEIIGLQNNRQAFGNNNEKRQYSNRARGIIQYDLYFNAIRQFSTMAEAISFNEGNKYWYYYIRESCLRGNTAYGYRWQYIEDLGFTDENGQSFIFNTVFDKNAYINGDKNIEILNNGLCKVKSVVYSDIKSIGASACKTCSKCGSKMHGDKCEECTRRKKAEEEEKVKNSRVKEITTMAENGMSLSEIGRHIGMSANGVKRILIKNDTEYKTKYSVHPCKAENIEESLEFGSVLEAAMWISQNNKSKSSKYNIATKIRGVINSRNTAYGYRWISKEDKMTDNKAMRW